MMLLLIYKILIAQVNFLSMSSAGMYRHDQLQRALHYTGLLLSHLLTKKYTFYYTNFYSQTFRIQMTHMILPKMFSRRRGVILNISSGAGIAPMPLMTVYAATKNYIDTFSRALRIECRGTGVQILVHIFCLTLFYCTVYMYITISLFCILFYVHCTVFFSLISIYS